MFLDIRILNTVYTLSKFFVHHCVCNDRSNNICIFRLHPTLVRWLSEVMSTTLKLDVTSFNPSLFGEDEDDPNAGAQSEASNHSEAEAESKPSPNTLQSGSLTHSSKSLPAKGDGHKEIKQDSPKSWEQTYSDDFNESSNDVPKRKFCGTLTSSSNSESEADEGKNSVKSSNAVNDLNRSDDDFDEDSEKNDNDSNADNDDHSKMESGEEEADDVENDINEDDEDDDNEEEEEEEDEDDDIQDEDDDGDDNEDDIPLQLRVQKQGSSKPEKHSSKRRIKNDVSHNFLMHLFIS